jgi:hypothetical protein
MKATREETACTCQSKNTQSRTGFLSQNKIKNLLRINNTSTQIATNANFGGSKAVYIEEEARRHEIEAELKKASARIQASVMPFR